jgi:ubiquinone/menaquinone biosynthesis C-methylase UbiE
MFLSKLLSTMENQKTNYNGISSNYNLRYKVNSMHGVSKTLDVIINAYKPKNILEVGCGTGQWLSKLDCYDAERIGIDSSLGMLKEAKKNGNKSDLICADANSLPFSNKQFDMIYCVNAIHHFKDKKEFIFSAAHLLNQNGTLSIVGVDPHSKNDEWYIYDFFEGVYEKDLLRFPSSEEVAKWMDDIGLKQLKKSTVECVVKEWIGNDVFNDTFLRKDQSSQLAILSDKEYSIGINKIRNAIEINPQVHFPVRLTLNSVIGMKG